VATDAKFDLIMNMAEADDRFIGVIDYNSDLYLETTMLRLWRNYEFVLLEVAARPESSLEQLRDGLAIFDAEHQQVATREVKARNLRALQGLRGKRNTTRG